MDYSYSYTEKFQLILVHNKNGKPRGYAFIEYQHKESMSGKQNFLFFYFFLLLCVVSSMAFFIPVFLISYDIT